MRNQQNSMEKGCACKIRENTTNLLALTLHRCSWEPLALATPWLRAQFHQTSRSWTRSLESFVPAAPASDATPNDLGVQPRELRALANEPWHRRPEVDVGNDIFPSGLKAVLAEQRASHKVRDAHRKEKSARTCVLCAQHASVSQ